MNQADEREALILAIETATAIGSIAVFEGAKLLGAMDMRRARSHARLLMPMIEQLLDYLEIKPAELSAIGVSKGPGSYTGLRVGVSTAKGLCMALDKPLLALGSLDTLALKAQTLAKETAALICPMLDARRMEVYCEVFDSDLNSRIPIEAKIIENDAFGDLLSEIKVIFLGDGAAKCRPILSQSPNSIILDDGLSSASDMGIALYKKFLEKNFEDLMSFEPFYLKSFVATKSKKKFF
ncbi:MAG: tRNA (adenosine(37)-N6)-threonylcarbamoyltransferase complex dimerization subunit type 1 TsaB [Bacteroidota bacterium]